MGNSTLSTVNTGDVIQAIDVNQLVSALKGDYVPRNSSGVAEASAGGLGSSSTPFSSIYVEVARSLPAGTNATSTLYGSPQSVAQRNNSRYISQMLTHSETQSHFPVQVFGRSRGTLQSPTAANSLGTLGGQVYLVHDGTTYRQAVATLVENDGVVESGSSPGQYSIYTTPSGSTSSTLRFRVTSGGNVLIGTATDSGNRLSVAGSAHIAGLALFNGRVRIGVNNGSIANFSAFQTGGVEWCFGQKIDGTFAFNNGDGFSGNDLVIFSTNGTITTAGGLLPAVDDSLDIGSLSRRFDDIFATNATIQTSDARLKKDVNSIALGLDFLNKLRPVSYRIADKEAVVETVSKQKKKTVTVKKTNETISLANGRYVKILTEEDVEEEVLVYDEFNLYDESGNQLFNEDGTPCKHKVPVMEEVEVVVSPERQGNRLHYGLIAQEVEAVLESLKIPAKDFAPLIYDSEADIYGIRYGELIALLIKAVQELSSKLENLK
jgi:hypothetical protein